MAKKRRQSRIPTPAWDHRPQGGIASRVVGRSFQFYGAVAIGVMVVVALAIAGFGFASDYIEDQRRPGSTALAVEETKFRLDYFSNRMEMFVAGSGGPGAVQQVQALQSTADQIIREEMLRRFAADEEITASQEDVDEALRVRVGISSGGEPFETAYEQELARTGLSDEQYKDMVRALVLEDNLTDKFQEGLPDSAESVHYRQILVSTEEAAQDIQQQLEGGADFAQLAEQSSLDTATREEGGDVGWVPRGALDASTEELVFDLKKGEITTVPLPQGVLVIEMLEKENKRKIEEDDRVTLAVSELEEWVQEKRESLDVVNNMNLADGDQEKIEWAVTRAYSQLSAGQAPAAPGQGG